MTHQDLSLLFQQFQNQCVWLKKCSDIQNALFGPDDFADNVLSRVSYQFFVDLSRIVNEYCMQRVCVLTDPPSSSGKPNLTIKAIDGGLIELGIGTTSILKLSERLMEFRGFVLPARHKLIAHLDQKVALNNEVLGAYPPERATEFYSDLQQYCLEVATLLGITPVRFSDIKSNGDVLSFVKFMRASVGR